jgi:hypothetical protein
MAFSTSQEIWPRRRALLLRTIPVLSCYNLCVAEETAKKQRNPAAHLTPHQFKPGQSGNPAGRPPGSISIIAKIKQKFQEDPEYFDEWVDELLADKMNRKAVMEQIDGKPHQTLGGLDGQPLIIAFDPNFNAPSRQAEGDSQ